MKFERVHEVREVTWTASVNSSEVNLEPGSVYSLYLPSTFTGTAVTVQSLEADGTWVDVFHDNAGTSEVLSTAVTADKRNILPAQLFAGLKVVRFVSTTSETVVGAALGMTS